MKLGRAATFGNLAAGKLAAGKLAAQFIFGCVVLAVMTAVCFFLQIGLAATACYYLVVILLFALMDSFVASGLLSLLAVAALNYFSAPPLFDFRISDPQDRLVIAPFLLASLIGSGLIQQARSERQAALAKPSSGPGNADLREPPLGCDVSRPNCATAKGNGGRSLSTIRSCTSWSIRPELW